MIGQSEIKVSSLHGDKLVVSRNGVPVVLSDLGEQELLETLLLWHGDRSFPPVCACTDRDTPLSICMRDKLIYLRAYPNTKWNHEAGCRFFGLPDMFDPDYQYTRAAKSIDEVTGVISLSGVLPTMIRGVQKADHGDLTVDIINPDRIRNKYAKVSAVGLLNELWRGSGLNTWPTASKPSWKDAISKIHQLSKKIRYNDCVLSERLSYLGGPGAYIASSWFDKVANKYRNSAFRDQRFFVIVALSGVGKSLYGHELLLRGSQRKIYCEEGLINMFERRYSLAFSSISEESSSQYCVALLSCFWSATGKHLKCDTGACIPVDEHLLPFDSFDSKKVGKRLVSDNRRFVKPLHVDSAEKWLPSYILLDTKPHTVIDVLDSNESQNARAVKDEYYRSSDASRWKWIPKNDKNIPVLPAVST